MKGSACFERCAGYGGTRITERGTFYGIDGSDIGLALTDSIIGGKKQKGN